MRGKRPCQSASRALVSILLIVPAGLLISLTAWGGEETRVYKADRNMLRQAVARTLDRETLTVVVPGYRGVLHLTTLPRGDTLADPSFLALVHLRDIKVSFRIEALSRDKSRLTFEITPQTKSWAVARDIELITPEILEELHNIVSYEVQSLRAK